MNIGPILRGWRDRHGMGVRAAAEIIGVSPATLCRIENDENVDGQTMVLLFKYLFDQNHGEPIDD